MRSATDHSQLNRDLIEMIDKCLRDQELAVEKLMEFVRRDDLPVDLASVVHALMHYALDEDIRERDTEYAAFSKSRLREIRSRMLGDSEST